MVATCCMVLCTSIPKMPGPLASMALVVLAQLMGCVGWSWPAPMFTEGTAQLVLLQPPLPSTSWIKTSIGFCYFYDDHWGHGPQDSREM